MSAHLRQSWSEQGSSGPAVVMLHSSMSSKTQWRALANRLAPTHRTLAIDLLGYGDAPLPTDFDRFTLADEVQRIQALVAQRLRRGKRFHLIGHSYGAAVALRLAQAEPQRVKSLGLFEPTAFHLVPAGDAMIAEVRRLAEGFGPCDEPAQALSQTRRFIDFWSGPGAFDALPEERRAALPRVMAKVRFDFRAIFNEPVRAAALATLRVKTCLVAGRSSPACAQRVVAELATVLPALEMHRVAAGHMAPVTHPDLVNPLFEAFIRRHDATGYARAGETATLVA